MKFQIDNLSYLKFYRLRFEHARRVLDTMKKVADEDKQKFLKEYPNGFADLESLNKDLDYMFEVLQQHEVQEQTAKS